MGNVLPPKRLGSGIEKLKAGFPVRPQKDSTYPVSLLLQDQHPMIAPFFSHISSSAGYFPPNGQALLIALVSVLNSIGIRFSCMLDVIIFPLLGQVPRALNTP